MLPLWYNEYKNLIDKSIKKYLDLYFSRWELPKWLEQFKEAVYYSTNWWKRIRSILALEFYIIFSWKKLKDIKFGDDIILYCISLELLHSYSLVHDDLPCMDNDEFRRWELTVWKKYSESTATLVWDFLNSISFEILSDISNNVDLKIILSYFWRAVWIYWMLWWQVMDLYYEKKIQELDIEILTNLHNKKTWALIETSIIWWIIISWKYENITKYLDFWKKVWLAFQIKDDILDVEWTKEETGKSVGWENKWFVYFMWIKKSKNYLNELINDSLNIISDLKSEKLNFLVDYIWKRNK
jgi:geranylgeranyl diphosphate synthase type II